MWGKRPEPGNGGQEPNDTPASNNYKALQIGKNTAEQAQKQTGGVERSFKRTLTGGDGWVMTAVTGDERPPKMAPATWFAGSARRATAATPSRRWA
jgi:hypothetical protein